jgi:hypothetical protein
MDRSSDHRPIASLKGQLDRRLNAARRGQAATRIFAAPGHTVQRSRKPIRLENGQLFGSGGIPIGKPTQPRDRGLQADGLHGPTHHANVTDHDGWTQPTVCMSQSDALRANASSVTHGHQKPACHVRAQAGLSKSMNC